MFMPIWKKPTGLPDSQAVIAKTLNRPLVSPKVGRALLPCALVWCALLCIANPLVFALRLGGLRYGYWTYNAGWAALNYFNTGFARRELQGTIISPLMAEPMSGVFWAHVLAYAALAGVGGWLCTRSAIPLDRQAALGVVLIAVLARLALDVGRTDVDVMLCGLAAAWAASTARWAVAAGALVVAVLFHEAGLIVLGPLTAAVAIASQAWRRSKRIDTVLAVAILALGTVLYLLGFSVRGDHHALGQTVHKLFANPDYADLALYENLTGARGMASAMCYTRMNPAYPLQVISGIGTCALVAAGLNPSRPVLALAATLLPYLALSYIATDIGRWACFGAFSAVTLSLFTPVRSNIGRRWPMLAAVSACALMSVGLDFRWAVFAPVPVLDNSVRAYGPKGPDPLEAITACDPTWRDAIGVRFPQRQ